MTGVLTVLLVTLGLAMPATPPDASMSVSGAPSGSASASPTARDLLLDLEARARYVERHREAVVVVRFKEHPIGRRAARFQPILSTTGVLVGRKGHARVLAPDHRLRHASDIRLVFADGREVAARARFGQNKLETPLAEIVARDAEGRKHFARYAPVQWAPDEDVEDGRRAWVLERPLAQPRPGKTTPVLVDTALGEKVEYPLERFRYIRLQGADGAGVLDAEGRLLCVVFRAVPGTATSLCAPREAAQMPLRLQPGVPAPAP